MRRRREFYILNCSNTVLTAIVFYSLLIDAKDLHILQAEASASPTETFDTTGIFELEKRDNESTGIGEEETMMTSSTQQTLMTSTTSTTFATPLPQNRFFVATTNTAYQHVTVPNDISVVSFNSTSTTHSTTKLDSSNNMPSSHDSSNSSNTSFSVRFTTMKPLIVPTLPDFSRHRIGHKQYQSKYHHDRHFGPFFEDPLNTSGTSGTLQVGFHEGTESILNCRVGMLKDKTVMWVRRTVDKVSLLTVGNITYSGDPRIKVMFIYPNNWRLSINPISPDDAGLYMCQVSTHPPRVFATNLTVLAPAIRLVDEMGHEVSDRYYKLGSSVDITCQVALSFLNTIPSPTVNYNDRFLSSLTTTTTTTTSSSTTTTIFPFIDTNLIKKTFEKHIPYNGKHNIKWKKDGKDLPKDIKINLSTAHIWRNSRISIIHAEKVHSGTYSCSVDNTTSSTVNIQILMGETPAAVQHNHCSRVKMFGMKIFIFNLGALLIFNPTLYISNS
ncbi:CLUMA_CG011396, isoform A [Clunio marinus]|uniref:CLUMA_CG011396, isoform A n=1 Tax=Clunio marinus TaxID=568069 RepID=A0A1J1ICU6_9DIPT|nr:CLUMA_CG011396, isoform A [Clunio marinus]